MAKQLHDDPGSYWNEQGGPSWVASQEMIDRILEPVTASILSAAELESGERLLDVGCGSGTLSLQAERRVGAEGSILGVDVSRPLIEHARERAVQAGAGSVEFLLADAQEAALPSRDVVVSRFGVMFFRDTEAAFRNVRSAVVHGGRLAVACWQPVDRNPWLTWTMPVVADLVPDELRQGPAADADVPGPFRFADPARLTSALEVAGFTDVEVQDHQQPLEMTASVDEILDLVQRIGPLSRLLGQLSPDEGSRAVERVRARAEELHDGEAIRLGAGWWLVTAGAAAG